MIGLPKATALAYSQLSRCLPPPDKDTSPNFTGIAGSPALQLLLTADTACTAESQGFTCPLSLLTPHLFGNNRPGPKCNFLEEPPCCVLQKKIRCADSLNLSCLQNTCKT